VAQEGAHMNARAFTLPLTVGLCVLGSSFAESQGITSRSDGLACIVGEDAITHAALTKQHDQVAIKQFVVDHVDGINCIIIKKNEFLIVMDRRESTKTLCVRRSGEYQCYWTPWYIVVDQW
jgi:hypothetical protein